jgi:hypothetical protein
VYTLASDRIRRVLKLTPANNYDPSTKTTLIPVVVAALAGFVCGYHSRVPNHSVEVVMARRAIPVKPEIRRAMPVKIEIRKAIPVQPTERRASKRIVRYFFLVAGNAPWFLRRSRGGLTKVLDIVRNL